MRALTKKEVSALSVVTQATTWALFIATKRRYGWKGVVVLLLVQAQSDISSLVTLHRAGAVNWSAVRDTLAETKIAWQKLRHELRGEEPGDLLGRDLP